MGGAHSDTVRLNMITLFILHFLLQIASSGRICGPHSKSDINSIWFKEDCHDVYEDSLCGEEALGERLYLGDDGEGVCDCDEGWIRYKEKCYQEFTPAFCSGENEILRLNMTPDECYNIYPEQLETCLQGVIGRFSCLENPCPQGLY